jgi:glycosyltransferase involved in cell wall biosynthesis
MDGRVSFVITARNENPAVVASTVSGIVTTAAGVCHEIVIVDDASTEPVDITGAGVTIIRHSDPIGVTRAREAGTNVTTANILFWLDAHMTFEPGWLQAMLREVDSGALLCAPWRDYDRTHVQLGLGFCLVRGARLQTRTAAVV